MFEHILVPVDGSSHANRAIDVAAALSEKFGSKLTLIHVQARSGTDQVPDDLKEFARIEHLAVNEAQILGNVAQAIVARAADRARFANVKQLETTVEFGDPATKIVDFAVSNKADTIVMGRRGLGDLAGLLLGSVSHKIAQRTDRVCITVEAE